MGKRRKSRVPLRKYTPRQKKAAIARTAEIGPTEASKELDIPSGTLSAWAHYAKKAQRRRIEAEKETKAAERGSQAGAAPPASTTDGPSSSENLKGSTRKRNQGRKRGRRVAKVYTPSQRAEALEYVAEEGVVAASRDLGISRFSLGEWRRKAAAAAAGEAVENPLVGPEDPKGDRDRRILKIWKAHPGLGPSQIRNQLGRQGFKVSVHTVRVLLEENGYVPPKVRRQEVEDDRYEAARPNGLWHLDFLHRHINKLHVYCLLLIDDFSRFIVGGALWDGERVAAVRATFEEAVARHGRPEKAMSDGGSAFYAWRGLGQFTRLLEDLEVDQLIAKTPRVNGKLEVLNANIQKELFNQERFFDLGETQRRLQAWIAFYNFRRTHHALGGLLVPADRYFGREQEVLAEIEAGRSPEGLGDPLPVSERTLDLFRVTTRGGLLEVWLLGKRLLVREDGR